MEFDTNLLSSVHCDRLNLRIHKVADDEFAEILSGLEQLALGSKIVNYRTEEKFNSIDYRHNIYIQTSTDSVSEGAIYIGWQHNSSKEKSSKHYDMKIEFNPSKLTTDRTFENGELVKAETRIADLHVYKMLGAILDTKLVSIIEFDVAVDFTVPINELITYSKKGRYMDLYKGTRYYGTKHKDMYLKVYDKQRERKEKTSQDSASVLTRLEYTVRPNNGSGIAYYALVPNIIKFDTYYTVALYNEDALTDNMISNILCIMNGLRQFMDFHKKNKAKIQKAIEENLVVVSIEGITRKYWEQIIEPIREWCFASATDSDSDDLMKRITYNNNEEWMKYLYDMKKLKKESE